MFNKRFAFHKLALALVICCFCLCTILSAAVMEVVGSEESEKRIDEIVDLTTKYVEAQGVDRVNVEQASAKILSQFLAGDFGNKHPAEKILTADDSRKMAADDLMLNLDKELPIPTEAEQEVLAAEKYPLYKVGDQIKVIYKKNPTTLTSVSGKITALPVGRVQVNFKTILVRDMQGITGNEEEILKLDPRATKELRTLFLEGYLENLKVQREKWKQDNLEDYRGKNARIAGEINEGNGYTFYRNQWLAPEALVANVVPDVIDYIQKEQRRKEQRIVSNGQNTLSNDLFAQATSQIISPVGGQLSLQKVLSDRAEAARKEELRVKAEQRAKEKALREAEQAAEETSKAKAALAEKRKAQEEQRKLEASRRKFQEELSKQDFEDADISILDFKFIIVFSVLIVVCGVMFIFWRRHENRGNDVGKYFASKGKMEKEFWAMAEADPDNFKYVSYKFPDVRTANEALAILSYIKPDVNGTLRCTKDIRFGTYKHQAGAVCFVGGVNLNYALWREASAVWPELDGASYFKVSSEPVVQLELPNMDSMSQEGIDVIEDGIDDLINEETGEVQRCYKYLIADLNNALLFLERTNVSEEGIIIQVTAETGEVYCKDINGVFQK